MIYIVIYVLLIGLAYFYDFRGVKRNKNRWYKTIMLIFIGLSGFRYYVGSDTFGYAIEFSEYPKIQNISSKIFLEFNYQPGWILLMSFCRTFSYSFFLPQLIVATFFNVAVFKIIRQYSEYPFIAILFYFSAQVFTGLNFEFMRETMAVALFLLGFKHFLKGSWAKYYFFLFFAFMFHVSASLFLLLPLIKKINLNNKKIIIILSVILLIAVVLGKTLIGNLLGYFSFGGSLSAKAQTYGGRAVIDSKSINFYIYSLSTYLFFPLIIIFYSISTRKNTIKFPNILLFYFIISILSTLSADFIRFNHYLFVFLLIEVSRSFYLIFVRIKPKIIFMILVPLTLNATNIHYLFFVNSSSLQNDKTYTRYYPYNSLFNKGMTKEREVYYRQEKRFNHDFSKY